MFFFYYTFVGCNRFYDMKKSIFLLYVMTAVCLNGYASPIKDSTARLPMQRMDSLMRKTPSFSIYRDNYFITGSNFDGGVNRYNTDVKFQISVMYRFSKGCSPKGRFAFLTYTQKSLWDIYQESAPFEDTNFNPSLGIGQHILKNGRYIGTLLFQAEHESNGQNDGEKNRSWNMVSATAIFPIGKNWSVQGKVWLPFWIADENKDIARYKGYWQVGGTYLSSNERWRVSLLAIKRGGWDLNMNYNAEIAFRLSRKSSSYLALQYYTGYGETLLNYKTYSNYIRFGFVIKPDRAFSIF